MRNEQERLAREWAERKREQAKRHWEDSGYSIREDTQAAIEHILATTAPPSMADVKWEDEKHYLAGATSEIDGSECVMIAPLDDLIVNVPLGGGRLALTSPGALTPDGKRYEPREIGDEPEHPETLYTVEDYENALDGTIVAVPGWGSVPLLKRDGKWHRDRLAFESKELAGDSPVAVLRWGWGE